MDYNYYTILNLPFNASQEEIKKAYRSLSLKYHPDKTSNDNDKNSRFQNILEAYKVLSNIKTRTNYDYTISNCFKNNSLDNIDNIDNNNIDNINNQKYNFSLNNESFKRFNNQDNIPNNHKNINSINSINNINNINSINSIKLKSIHIIKYISYEESFNGITLPIEITRHISEYNEEYNEIETIYINIPKGSDHNEIIIIKNKGNCYNGLYSNVKIKIKLLENSNFERCGLDLIYLKTITFKESICGFSFKLKHLNNKFYTINNETGIIIHDNYTTTINKLGFIKDDICGNLIIKYNIIYPEKLSEEIIENIRKIL